MRGPRDSSSIFCPTHRPVKAPRGKRRTEAALDLAEGARKRPPRDREAAARAARIAARRAENWAKMVAAMYPRGYETKARI